jgi:hypothetical protein
MMYMEKNTGKEDSQKPHYCKICGGKGIILVYRSDLEEFEEIKCEEINLK